MLDGYKDIKLLKFILLFLKLLKLSWLIGIKKAWQFVISKHYIGLDSILILTYY